MFTRVGNERRIPRRVDINLIKIRNSEKSKRKREKEMEQVSITSFFLIRLLNGNFNSKVLNSLP